RHVRRPHRRRARRRRERGRPWPADGGGRAAGGSRVSGIGRSVRLFLVEGTANGIITAEIVNWTGHVLMAPRAKLHDVLARSEAQRTGIYFLFGEIAEIGGKQPVYIGESDNVGRR